MNSLPSCSARMLKEKTDVTPFYISLNVHDRTLHNAMLDSGASHNLMSKVVMGILGLDFTRPYKDLFSFDSRQIKCLGLIKDLAITLTQIPSKSVIMDILVVDIPGKFGMLLSRSWDARIKGTLQMDMSYTTIPIFREMRRLYRETRPTYMVSCQENPHNHPIYAIDIDLGSSIFFNDVCCEPSEEEVKAAFQPVEEKSRMALQPKDEKCRETKKETESEGMWEMFFDGASSKEGARVRVWVRYPDKVIYIRSFKRMFKCTINVDEYEALMLGLGILKEKGATKICVKGDSKFLLN